MITLLRHLAAFILSIVMLFTSCSKGDDNSTNPAPQDIVTPKDLSSYLENLVHTNEIPGFSVSVALGNGIAYQQSFGYANIANQKPYTNETINNIASVSKTFVGAATAKAIEQGYFTLETNINDILPIEINNPKQPNSPIKIKHLVTHTSGIIDVPSIYIPTNYYILEGEDVSTSGANFLINNLEIPQSQQIPLDDYLTEVLLEDGDYYNLDQFLNAAPGESWIYSNNATSLMGYIIEYVSGQSFDDYVDTYILTPLQMSNSTYDIYQVDLSNMATQYFNENMPLPKYHNHGYPEGSILSNNEDLGNYLVDMMRGVRGESSLLFSTEYYHLLFDAKLLEDIVPSGFAENHGLFWYLKNGNLMHGGNSLGISSHLQFKQDGTSGYFIVSNMDGTLIENESKWEDTKQLISNAIEQFINNN